MRRRRLLWSIATVLAAMIGGSAAAPAADLGASLRPLSDLFAQSDYITLHVALTLETFAHELTLTNEEDVRIYVRVFEGFQRAAVFGGGACALVERVMRDYEKVARSIH